MLIYNLDKTTRGVTGRDVTDADVDKDDTDAKNSAVPVTQSGPPRTHEKADMAVVSATYPGELKLRICFCLTKSAYSRCWLPYLSAPMFV